MLEVTDETNNSGDKLEKLVNEIAKLLSKLIEYHQDVRIVGRMVTFQRLQKVSVISASRITVLNEDRSRRKLAEDQDSEEGSEELKHWKYQPKA